MSAQQHPAFLDDPVTQELLDIARSLEISVLHELTATSCKVTLFFEYPDKRLILAEHESADIKEALHTALGVALEKIERENL